MRIEMSASRMLTLFDFSEQGDSPRNPYPDRPECEQEWAEAASFCLRLKASNQLGRGDYRGMGKTLSECITGQVSEDCGGNSTGT
jgi:hypothetical protein